MYYKEVLVFNLNKKYTRTDIQQALGGEIQTYLPQKGFIILAGCFNRELNPDCPTQIQAGSLPKVIEKAKLLKSQPQTIFPVFTKETENDKYYTYVGQFKCKSASNNKELIHEAELKSGRHGKISYLLNLEKVSNT
jgi:hypothetical protein